MTPSSAKPSRRILLRTVSVVVGLVAVLVALVAGTLAPYYFSAHVAQTSLLALTAIAAYGVVAWLGMRLGAALWRTNNPARFATASATALTVVFVVALYIIILRPLPLRYTDVVAAENGKYWHLTSGSTISYQEFLPPSGTEVKPDPIVFLHGGPGLRFGPFDSDIYSTYADDGFRVYLYDQTGSGASTRLDHVRDYTIARAVEDLEAIRIQLGAERMILIGHSWGSTLAASYMAKYPAHVSKVVFHSPGSIWNIRGSYPYDYSRTDAGTQTQSLPPLRFIAGLYLLDRNLEAGEQAVPQREAEDMMGPLEASAGSTVICKGDAAKLPAVIARVKDQVDNPGLNPYVLQRLIDLTMDPRGDPHTELKTNKTPAILLVGECNYIPWTVALDYRQTFANLKIFSFPKAGHYLQFEQPEMMTKVIRSFLLEQPDAIPPYTSDADPRPPAN
jgi:pimeloyl-ACP methyl ester carboxylesterase